MGMCMSTTETEVTHVGRKRFVTGRKQRKRELKKWAMEALTNEAQRDLLLATPGRMIRIGASDSACIFTQQGRKGTNQDAMLVWERFGSMEDTVFCGVFDGHGPFGHLVSRRVRDSLPSKLVALWRDKLESREDVTKGGCEEELQLGSFGDSKRTEYGSNVSTTYESAVSDAEDLVKEPASQEPPPMFGPWRESHLLAFKEMDQELCTHPAIDCFCSGSTTVTVLKQGRHLVIGNVGDSRAILGTRDEKGRWKAVQLTVDLKPNLTHEAERIKECHGRVFALQDEPEVMRVWLPFDNSPGLAMARAFGDSCLKDYGVIAVPVVTYRQVTDRDKFIVLASDGIWDVLSNEEAVHIIATAPSRATAARSLVESAVRMWRFKYPSSKVDDCAVVCLYLGPATDTDTPSETSKLKNREDVPTRPSIIPQMKSGVGIDGADKVLENGKRDARVLKADVHQIGEILDSLEVKELDRSEAKRHRTLGDLLQADESEEWNALDGFTRVNSLMNLPRFPDGSSRPEGPVTNKSLVKAQTETAQMICAMEGKTRKEVADEYGAEKYFFYHTTQRPRFLDFTRAL